MYLVTQDAALVGNLKTLNGGVAVQAKRGTVTFEDTTAKTLFTLPAGAIPLDVLVDVTTAFDDTGTDLLDIGKAGAADHFVANLDVAAQGRKVPTRTNLGVSVGASEIAVQATFAGQNEDAEAGEAVITVLYIVP